MKCQFCNADIEDDSVFCTECGKKQEKPVIEKETITPKFCTQCGTELKEDALFCVGCGAKVELSKQPERENVPRETVKQVVEPMTQPEMTMEDPMYDPIYDKGKVGSSSTGKKAAIVIGSVLCAVLLITAGFFGVKVAINHMNNTNSESLANEEKEETEEDKTSSTEAASDETTEEAAKVTEEKPKADFDLTTTDTISLTGYVKNSTSGNRILQWSEGISIYGTDKTLLEDVKSARIDESSLPEGLLDAVEDKEQIVVSGKASVEDGKIYIEATKVCDTKGKDLSENYSESLSEDYIIPNSSSRLLSEEDIEDLTLQELNYAKNEIYARHGRKFDSKELQDYFNSKSWYEGTIAPADFSDDMLSKIERDNVKLIKNKEFSINPKGYQLDQ